MADDYEPQYDGEADWSAPVAADDGPPPVSVDDSITGGDFMVNLLQFIGTESSTGSATVETADGSKEMKGIITNTGDSWLAKASNMAKSFFGFSDAKGANNDFPKLLATGAALAIGGAGKAYTDNKRLAQEKEIADRKLLIESQNAGILQQKMANQNFSNVKFKAPPTGLINTFKPAKITPFQDRMKA